MNAQSLLMSAAYYMEDVSDPVSTLLWIGLAILVALILVVVFLRFVPLGLWITSLAAGVHVSISSLVGMRLRRIQPKRLVEPLIKARKAGLDVTLSKLETHLLAGGNVDRAYADCIEAQPFMGIGHERACNQGACRKICGRGRRRIVRRDFHRSAVYLRNRGLQSVAV